MGILTIFSGGTSVLYKWLAIGGVALTLTVGGYLYGNHVGSMKSKLVIAQYTAKHDKDITDLLGIQTITNEKIVEKVVTKTIKIHDQGVSNENIAKTAVPDSQPLSNGWVYLHDIAAIGNDAESTRASDGTSSGVAANQALVTIVNNYATCRQIREEYIGLQDWVKQTKANLDKVNKQNK
jgi:hypothetical protein